jgi:predicted MFS family arabinose efflux permease
VAATLAALANSIAMSAWANTLIAGRLLSGIATGVLVATVTRAAARREDAQRTLASMQAAAVLLVSMVFFISANLVDRWGPAGLFAILAGISGVMIAPALLGLPRITATHSNAVRITYTDRFTPVVACLGLVAVFIGQSSVSIYAITLGGAIGLDGRTMGMMLAIGLPLSMLGAIAARVLGERAGLLRPLLIGLALLMMSVFYLVKTGSPVVFCILADALGLFVEFCVPYAIAVLSRLDPSGHAASVAPGCMIVGLAVGPALAGKVIGTAGFQSLGLVAASSIGIGIALFAAAGRLSGIRTLSVVLDREAVRPVLNEPGEG